jgi:hypothetical protein
MPEETQQDLSRGLRIALNMSQEIIFCEAVTVETTPENVKLSFIQSLPSMTPSGGAIHPNPALPPGVGNQFPNAKVVARVALTWPHFIRLASSFTDTVKNNQEAVKASLDNLVEAFNNEKNEGES